MNSFFDCGILIKKKEVFFVRQKLFDGKNYEKRCEHCLNGKLPSDKSVVLCKKFGVVSLDFCCKSFRYDPLKRVPKRARLQTEFNEDEFKL